MPTSNLSVQNWFETSLSSSISASDTTIPLNTVPTVTEGYLIIDPDNPSSRECIYYTSKTGSAVLVPDVANGRGQDGTSAVSHSSGATVRMVVNAQYWKDLKDLFTTTPQGWTNVGYAPNTVTYNGNGSYDLVFNSVDLTSTVSNGMRLRTTRTVAAPNQCASLNGTNQYFNDTSVSGMTFTDDFVVSAWVKLSSYNGAVNIIASRYNGTSGWVLALNSTGIVRLSGYNASGANYSEVTSYQSIPLNKWVHIAAQLDMSAFTATTTTSYVMINGVDVPSSVARGGTNPTALVQAGNLEIGSTNGGTLPFPGKIAQVAIYSAKVTQANIRATISQGLTGSETNLVSAYSLSNSLNDLNTGNANNLTAQNSASTTNADSPFGTQANGTISTTLDYGIVMKTAFSTNTTLTVQVPEGCTIPTTGGVTSVSYSTQKAPYGFPGQRGKWRVNLVAKASQNFSPAALTWTYSNLVLNIPTGEWTHGYSMAIGMSKTTAATNVSVTLSSGSATESNTAMSAIQYMNATGATTHNMIGRMIRESTLNTTTLTPYYFNVFTGEGGTNTISIYGGTQYGDSEIYADNAHL